MMPALEADDCGAITPIPPPQLDFIDVLQIPDAEIYEKHEYFKSQQPCAEQAQCSKTVVEFYLQDESSMTA